jgi:hypothetical protein
MPIETPANAMFRRTRDVFIPQKLKKTPLDVGANRIARSAYAALAVRASGRCRSGLREKNRLQEGISQRNTARSQGTGK